MEEEKSVLRVGGLAGVLAGVFFVLGLIPFAISPFPADLEQALATFPEDRTRLAVTADLLLVGLLLFLAFLAALYGSLKKPSPVFARVGLGSGVLALILSIVVVGGSILAADAFSGLYDGAAVSDRPVVVATYAAVVSLLQAGNSAGYLFFGLAFVAFGLAMRGSPDFGEGLAWLSVVLGIGVFLLMLLFLAFSEAFIALAAEPAGLRALLQTSPPAPALAVFALLLGWKVYRLSRAA